jgi:hypothetical protein
VAGQAFSFNGANQNVTVADSQAWDFGPCDFSISLWAKSNDVGSVAPLISHDEGGGNLNKWIFYVQPWGGLTFHINSYSYGEGGLNVVTYGDGSFFMTPGRWYHLAVTKAGTQYILYLDGRRVASNSGPNMIPSADATLMIGQAEGYPFNGLIDEIKIYRYALSHAEIRTFGFLQGVRGVAEQ